MNKGHGDKGFEMLTGTGTFAGSKYGISVTSPVVIAAITFADHYTGDAALVGKTLPVGYYPFRFSSIQLASGEAVSWREF